MKVDSVVSLIVPCVLWMWPKEAELRESSRFAVPSHSRGRSQEPRDHIHIEKFHSRASGGAYAEVVLVTCLCQWNHDGNYARSMA